MQGTLRVRLLAGLLLLLPTRVRGQDPPPVQIPQALVDSAYRLAANLLGDALARRSLAPLPRLHGYERADSSCAGSQGGI